MWKRSAGSYDICDRVLSHGLARLLLITPEMEWPYFTTWFSHTHDSCTYARSEAVQACTFAEKPADRCVVISGLSCALHHEESIQIEGCRSRMRRISAKRERQNSVDFIPQLIRTRANLRHQSHRRKDEREVYL